MLRPADAPAEKKVATSQSAEADWTVIVKQTFIEVKIPPNETARRRAMSDSALPFYEKTEKPWKSISSDKLPDISDTSTNVSAEAEAEEGVAALASSEDDGEVEATEVCPAPAMPYQYVESWWVPMAYSTGMPATGAAMSSCYEQAPQQNYDESSFTSMRWSETSAVVPESHIEDEWRTSVMIRNMPTSYTRDMLLDLVDSMGLAGAYDFVYLPIDFKSQTGLGYALMNFTSVVNAQRCFARLEGFCNWRVPCDTVCAVAWSSPTQGLEAHLERYRNSPVMHHSLPDEWKPVLLRQGMRVAFPPPSKAIKTPKVRKQVSNLRKRA